MNTLLWLLLAVTVLCSALLGGGKIFLKWCLEPVGIAIPAFATLAVLFAPQMPDMFYGMAMGGFSEGHPSEGWQHALGFPLAAALLGLESWYWTRAALYGRIGLCDAAWLEHSRAGRKDGHADPLSGSRLSLLPDINIDVQHGRATEDSTPVTGADWSDTWSPRVGLIVSAAVTVSPIILFLQNKMTLSQLGPIAVAISVGLVIQIVIYVLTVFRAFMTPAWLFRLVQRTRLNAESFVWKSRVASNFAAAPLGWPTGLAMLLFSLFAAIIVSISPEMLDFIHAPTAAILALAFLIAPITVILAALRDVAGLVLLLLEHVISLFGQGAAKVIADRRTEITRRGMADALGFTALMLLPSFYSWAGSLTNAWSWTDLYPVRAVEVGDGGERAAVDGRPTFDTALQSWMTARQPGNAGAGGRMPVVIVAVEGGASRSAAWFLPVMRMLDEQTGGALGKYVFAISGVSGGSLGAATYEELAARSGGPGVTWKDANVRKGIVELARGDLLAPAIATFFLPDTLHRLLQPVWLLQSDRAAALERRFERNWAWREGFAISAAQARQGFLALQASRPPGALPLLFLNGTDVQTGRRLITSSVQFKATDDLFGVSDDFLDELGHDVPMSTAVTNSARFPFISPAGRFDPADERSVVDGGVFENYGARTAWELARKVSEIGKDAVEPIIVLISDDTDGLAAPWNPTETYETGMRAMEKTVLSCLPLSGASETQIVNEARHVEQASGAGYVPEGINSLQGLYSTRGAHGKGELYTIRRTFCAGDAGGPQRFIHIDLPRFVVEEEQAAPMNWVLNQQVCKFFLGPALAASFNERQTDSLRKEFARLLVTMPDEGRVPKPESHEADCDFSADFSSGR